MKLNLNTVTKNLEKTLNVLIKIYNFNNPWVKEEIKSKVRKYSAINKDENTIYQTLQMALTCN